MTTPADRKYAKTHEWIKIDGDSATVGITAHAQEALGDITFVELPRPGTAVKAGSSCGVIESVKAASDIYSPVSGQVATVNAALESAPETVNADPYGEGWLFTLSRINPAEAASLMDAAAYDDFLKSGE